MSRFAGLLLLTLLFGCRSSPTVAPYFYGTFVGYYLTSPTATPTGMRVETKLLDTEQKRYTFSGTAILGAETYTLEGYEATASEVGFLSAQAVPPPMGELVATLKDADGTPTYVLCSEVTYKAGERHTEPHTYALYRAEAAPDTCGTEDAFATVQLERR